MKQALYCLIVAAVTLYACRDDQPKQPGNEDTTNTNTLPPAVTQLQDAVQLKPDSAALRFKLATALDSIGKQALALQQLDSLIRKDSLNYGFWFAKGQVAENAGDTTLALQSYARAANIYEAPEALRALANLYAETKNDRALLICSRIMALGLGREYDADCNFIAGVYYARTGDDKKAIRFFDAAIAANYTYMEAYIEKGLVYFDNRQYAEALQVFRFAATVNNLYADAYYYQARCFEMMQVKDSAVLRFKQALQLDHSLDEAREHLKSLGEQ